MLNKLRSKQGFTLIELLIVVAIIGILAAIAIPQFSAYRVRGYNSTAISDMKNAKTAEESLYADNQCYGMVDAGAVGALLTAAPTAAAAAAPAVLQGPVPAAVGGAAPVAGGRIAGINANNSAASIPVGVSNGVNIGTEATTTGTQYDSYVVVARHENADTAYGADSDNTTATYKVSNPAWVGVMNVLSATVPGATLGVNDFGTAAAPAAGGGSPTANWQPM